MKVLLFLCLLTVSWSKAEILDVTDIGPFCYPEQVKDSHRACQCSEHGAGPYGVLIDCSYKTLKLTDLSNYLPIYTDTLDLSWNALNGLPVFSSDSLAVLNLMHNNISMLRRGNFMDLMNLRELYLNWNSIQTIEAGAFEKLTQLQVLDLSHNNVHALEAQIFAPLLALQTLNLGWNRQLVLSTAIETSDFYQAYGVKSNLRVLNLEACGLSNLVLPEQATLLALNLRRNQLTRVPAKLPKGLQQLDLSANLLRELGPSDMAERQNLQLLYLEDMPQLETLAPDALRNLPALSTLSFQNSRLLSVLHGEAFGVNGSEVPALRTLIFRGTSLRSINGTLGMRAVFEQLSTLDLNGVPLQCDCQLSWVSQLPLETEGICMQPARLRGLRISSIPVGDFDCRAWPEWVSGLIILGLLLLCSTGIYFLVLGLRPHRGVHLRRKVGAGSPYARVTIEPNNQEYNHF